MWLKIARFILNNRLVLLIAITALVLLMAFIGKDAKIAYSSAKIVPSDHPKFIEHQQFKEKFGEGGNIFFIGLQTDRFFNLDFFNDWYELGEQCKKIEGVEAVISLATAPIIEKDTVNKKFDMPPAITGKIGTQQELDSLKTKLLALPFYENILYKKEDSTFLMALNINNDFINSERRFAVSEEIVATAEGFSQKYNIPLRYSGMPYIRAVTAKRVNAELELFLILSIIAAAVLLLLLFRSFQAMFFPMLIVLGGIAFTMGTIVLLGYEITMLIGLIPPVIVAISVPNCVYLINRYYREMEKHGNKEQALEQVIQRIGYVIFYANLTTAIGFSVFSLMRSESLREFGIVAGINIAVLFFTSLVIIPVILSFLPAPKRKHKHLQNNIFTKLLAKIFPFVAANRWKVIGISLVLLLLAIGGIIQLESKSYIFDDVSKNSTHYTDLKFFESKFNGVIPFDVMVNTGKKNGATKSSILKRVEKIQGIFTKDSLFARPMSLVEGLKFAKQAYFSGLPKYYDLPSQYDKNFILSYLSNTKGEGTGTLVNSFTDSTKQIVRISTQMADVGTHEIPTVLDSIQSKVAAVIDTSRYKVSYTGSTIMAYVGNKFLIEGLIQSVLLAFALIALVIAFIFRQPKMLLIAFIPNIIPLAFTAALMGYSGIYLKPATVLIFSVALGISVDFTIHFLAKYRQERLSGRNSTTAIQKAINETGLSMTYTAIILFFGFIIFTASSFQGTFYLGILTSTTIIVAIVANLVLLPSILLAFDGGGEGSV